MQRFVKFSLLLMLSMLSMLFSQAFGVAQLPAPAASRVGLSQTTIDAEVKGDSVEGYRLRRLHEEKLNASFASPNIPVTESNAEALPAPAVEKLQPKRLSLEEAIALALRNNPNVQTAELQRVLDKFSLNLALQPSRVQWTPLTFSSTLQNKQAPVWLAGTGVAVNAPTGTSFSIAHSNNLLGGMGSNTISMTQHLLKGFGYAVNDVPYQNAFDAEKVAKLNFKNSIISVVVTVITNYRNLVSAYNTLTTNQQAVDTQKKVLQIAELKLKEGINSLGDVIQQKEQLESLQLAVAQGENSLQTTYQTFLSSLGLRSSSNIVIDKNISTVGVKVPSQKKCVALGLKNNIAYRTAIINLKATERALITAKDARKWTLDMTSSVVAGSTRTIGSPITDAGTNPTLAFSLSVPIDNIAGKQGVVSAQIAIQNAKLNLVQLKEDTIRNVETQWESVRSLDEQVKLAESAVKAQETVVRNKRLEMTYGRVSIFEVNTDVNNLVQQQLSLISTKISYLQAVTTLYQTLGLTLDEYHIRLRY